MDEWFPDLMSQMAANYALILGRVFDCPMVVLMRWFSLALAVLWALKLIVHILSTRTLIHQTPLLAENEFPGIWTAYRHALARVRLRRIPALYRYACGRYPAFTVRDFQPAVFLNPNLARDLERDELEALLVHELVHVKRRDNLKIRLFELATAAIPLLTIQLFGVRLVYGPLALAISLTAMPAAVLFCRIRVQRRLRERIERSCDDRTVQLMGRPLILASALVKTWKFIRKPDSRFLFHPQLHQPVSAAGGGIEGRIQRLLDYKPPRAHVLLAGVSRLGAAFLLWKTLTFLWLFHATDRFEPVVSACRAFAASMFP